MAVWNGNADQALHSGHSMFGNKLRKSMQKRCKNKGFQQRQFCSKSAVVVVPVFDSTKVPRILGLVLVQFAAKLILLETFVFTRFCILALNGSRVC